MAEMYMTQKSLLRKISLFLAGSLKLITSSNYFRVIKRFFFFFLLLVAFIFNACATDSGLQKEVFQKVPGTIALIIFADTPFKTIDIGHNERGEKQSVSFYQWLYNAFKNKKNPHIVIFDDKTIVSRAISKNIKPAVSYWRNNPKSEIIHLAFDETQIEDLYAVAEDLGASYLIKARLILNDVKIEHKTSDKVHSFVLSSFVHSHSEWDEISRVTTVEFTIYDVQKRDILQMQELSATASFNKTPESLGFLGGLSSIGKLLTTGKLDSELGLDIQVRNNLVLALTALLSSQTNTTQSSGNSYKSNTITINKHQKVWMPEKNYNTIIQKEFILKSVSSVDKNLIQFNLSLMNNTDDEIRIRLQKSGDKLDSYIVDCFGIRYTALSSSLSENIVEIKPGVRKDFFLVFPMPSTTSVRQVDMYSKWDIQIPQRTHTITLEFKDVPIP